MIFYYLNIIISIRYTIMSKSIDYNMPVEDVGKMPYLECDYDDELKNALSINIDKSKLILEMQSLMDNFDEISIDIPDNKLILEDRDNIVSYSICPNCNISCKISDTMMICEQCGMERDWDTHTNDFYSMTVDQNYNTNSNAFMTFSIVGVNSYCYNRSLLKTCADYSMYRNSNNKKDIINKVYQYEGSKPPLNIINGTADLFEIIKNKGYVFRGDGKLGVIAACMYYVSIEHNLTRTPKEISQIFGIDEKFLSQGDRTLQELNELGIISIQTNHKPLNDYLNMFFPTLGISEKYRKFVVDIITRAERKHLHIGHESRLTTKVIGVIYLLTQRVPELKHIKKNTISEECNKISKSTFIRYHNLICDNYVIMKKVFRKHRIPMPVEWRAAV